MADQDGVSTSLNKLQKYFKNKKACKEKNLSLLRSKDFRGERPLIYKFNGTDQWSGCLIRDNSSVSS